MAKKKGISYEQIMIDALKTIPNPIVDKRHNLFIHFINDKARSNESRFDHIIDLQHELHPSDIKHIPSKIKTAIFKKDKERKETFNYYIKRTNNNAGEYIKISVRIEQNKPQDAYVKTIFITKNIK